VQNELYIGIVVDKTGYGVFLDIGFHYEWRYGSMVGLLHRKSFEKISDFENVEPGQSMEVFFLGRNSAGKLVFGTKPEPPEWFDNEIDGKVGELVWVRVQKDERGKTTYLAEGRYQAILPYGPAARQFIKGR